MGGPRGKARPVCAMRARELAAVLFEAERNGTPVAPLTGQYPGMDVRDAYAIQAAYVSLRVATGGLVVGRKIGATSAAIQELFNVHTPDFGHLFSDMWVPNDGTVQLDSLIAPMIEPEVCFRLALPLKGPGVTGAEVLAATASVAPALEIIDSRIQDWNIAFADTVADNGSSARFVVGKEVGLEAIGDLAEEQVTLYRDGEAVEFAAGIEVLGHPAESVAWLANALGELGEELEAGQLILSGSFTRAVPAEGGRHYQGTFDTLGEVACTCRYLRSRGNSDETGEPCR